MKKFKRLIAIVPIVFVLLLSCVPLGSALADDNSEYFLSFDELDYEELITENVRDYVLVKLSEISGSTKSALEARNYNDYLYYFYNIYHGDTNRKKFVNHSDSSDFFVDFCLFSDDSILYEDDTFVVYDSICCSSFNFSVDTSGAISEFTLFLAGIATNSSHDYFIYNKVLGTTFHRQSLSVPTDFSGRIFNSLHEPSYIYYQDCTIPNFPFADGINHGGNDSLNVFVSFTPELNGSVDRKFTDSNGNTAFSSSLKMSITNNSKFAIQYKMYIMKKNQVTSRPHTVSGSDSSSVKAYHQIVYDDDPVFVYYSNEWVYSINIDSSADFYNGLPQRQNKTTDWHYLSSGNSSDVSFNYSQINLTENEDYVVYVEAIRNDYDVSSSVFVTHATSEAAYPELKQIYSDDKEVVYQSEFVMIHYSDVKYDPTDTSNGVMPYSTYADGQSYAFSYNAKETDDGDIDYNSKNVYTDSDSWWGKSYNPSNISYSSSYSSGSSSSFNGLSNSFSSFFRFVNTTFGYFPSSFISVFSLGMTAIVIIGIIKAVFK